MHPVKVVLKVMDNLCHQLLWMVLKLELWVTKVLLQDLIIKMNQMVGVMFGVKKNEQMVNIELIEKNSKKLISLKLNLKVLLLERVK